MISSNAINSPVIGLFLAVKAEICFLASSIENKIINIKGRFFGSDAVRHELFSKFWRVDTNDGRMPRRGSPGNTRSRIYDTNTLPRCFRTSGLSCTQVFLLDEQTIEYWGSPEQDLPRLFVQRPRHWPFLLHSVMFLSCPVPGFLTSCLFCP